MIPPTHYAYIRTERTATGPLEFFLRAKEWNAMGTLLTHAKRTCPHALYPDRWSIRLNATNAIEWGDSILHLVGIVWHDQQAIPSPHPRADAHRIWRLNMDYWASLGQALVSSRVPVSIRIEPRLE